MTIKNDYFNIVSNHFYVNVITLRHKVYIGPIQ